MTIELEKPGPGEPTPATLGGRDPVTVIRRYVQATRPMFLTASILPVLVGTSWGYRAADELDLSALVLAVAATACVHASVNVLNDVFDDLGGSDPINTGRIFPYTGGSRFIQNGVLSIRAMAVWSVVLLLLGVLLGAVLILEKGIAVLGFGLVGVALGIAYSAPPLQLSARGLGEAAVGMGFGVLPVVGAAWLQSPDTALSALLLSVPVACWAMAILLINEVPDQAADAATGKRTLVVRLGPTSTVVLLILLQILALIAIATVVGLHWLPLAVLVAHPVLLMAAIYASLGGVAGQRRLKRSIELTLMIHAFGGVWLSGWLLVPA
ncbi:prenyltransferase [Pseudomonas sp. SA3-5]|uniref:Prenyltransferase n=1 Tax=Pseudomonas aestuarii TaxID=3018340 RepID=A0ABT4XDX6_9PSED|nr:prenyltransferase [Pseudomonas aestuarii]MDA7086406.1 prenyltransferase [Pseudomonas aestuarii]